MVSHCKRPILSCGCNMRLFVFQLICFSNFNFMPVMYKLKKMGKKRKISSSDSNNVLETEYFVEINDIIKTCSKEVFGNKPKIAEIKKKSTKCRPKVQTPELLGQDNVVIAKKEPEIVVFKSRNHKIVKRNEKSTEKEEILVLNNSEEMNSKEILEKLKFDVGSFGLKGFSIEEQRRQEKQRAIKLGAKPERREYVNYKVKFRHLRS